MVDVSLVHDMHIKWLKLTLDPCICTSYWMVVSSWLDGAPWFYAEFEALFNNAAFTIGQSKELPSGLTGGA